MTHIDIHTHIYTKEKDVIAIENVLTDFTNIPSAHPISIGLHPWHLGKAETEFAQLKAVCHQPNVVAIGEFGLDRLAETEWNRQVRYFEKQADLAMEVNKPLIIHCVRAFFEVLGLLKNCSVPVIFHGVNKKFSTLQPLLNAGFYLSFGKALLQPSQTIIQAFNAVPFHQLFLETDDANVSIQEIYKTAAKIRNVSENEIALQILKNYRSVFLP